MPKEQENPHLFTDFANPTVVKVKQLAGGILLPLTLLRLATQDFVDGECLVPVYRGKFSGGDCPELVTVGFSGGRCFHRLNRPETGKGAAFNRGRGRTEVDDHEARYQCGVLDWPGKTLALWLQSRLPSSPNTGTNMKDLKSPKGIWLKGVLFAIIAVVSGGLLVLEMLTFRVAILRGLAIWASCRAYYFAFYVIEHYVDPSFHFSGLGSFMVYLFRKKSSS